MSGRLAGKVAIVTGAGCVGPGWGNGRATAVRFAEEGATVFAVDLRADTMEETLKRVRDAGGEVDSHLCDVTDGAAVEAMVAACVARFGRVDILVNNVGGSARGGPVEMAEEVWDAQVDFNQNGGSRFVGQAEHCSRRDPETRPTPPARGGAHDSRRASRRWL